MYYNTYSQSPLKIKMALGKLRYNIRNTVTSQTKANDKIKKQGKKQDNCQSSKHGNIQSKGKNRYWVLLYINAENINPEPTEKFKPGFFEIDWNKNKLTNQI